MKSESIFIYLSSLLLLSLFSPNVYGEETSQSIGDDSKCSAQFEDSHENHVNLTCIYNINYPEPTSSSNHSAPLPERTESTYPLDSPGYIPKQSPPLQITDSPGYMPEHSPSLQITSSPGYTPE